MDLNHYVVKINYEDMDVNGVIGTINKNIVLNIDHLKNLQQGGGMSDDILIFFYYGIIQDIFKLYDLTPYTMISPDMISSTLVNPTSKRRMLISNVSIFKRTILFIPYNVKSEKDVIGHWVLYIVFNPGHILEAFDESNFQSSMFQLTVFDTYNNAKAKHYRNNKCADLIINHVLHELLTNKSRHGNKKTSWIPNIQQQNIIDNQYKKQIEKAKQFINKSMCYKPLEKKSVQVGMNCGDYILFVIYKMLSKNTDINDPTVLPNLTCQNIRNYIINYINKKIIN